MIKVKQKGNFNRSLSYLIHVKNTVKLDGIEKYAQQGVDVLSEATPKKTGLTAASWHYNIKRTKNTITIEFLNSNIQNGVPVAIVLFYGHATRNGGYVEGIDYINPALRPIFEHITNDAWREMTGK